MAHGLNGFDGSQGAIGRGVENQDFLGPEMAMSEASAISDSVADPH
jgi:hypothetical protein